MVCKSHLSDLWRMSVNQCQRPHQSSNYLNKVIYVLQRAETERMQYFLLPLSFITTSWYHSWWQRKGWCQGTGAASKCNCLNQVRQEWQKILLFVILCANERNLSFQLHKTALEMKCSTPLGQPFFLLLLQKKIITIKMSNLEKRCHFSIICIKAVTYKLL